MLDLINEFPEDMTVFYVYTNEEYGTLTGPE